MTWLRRAYEGKKVLVTGHTGFKGSWLSEWLLGLGAEVSGYALPAEEAEGSFRLLNLDSRMDHCAADVRNSETFSEMLHKKPFDLIFHLAAQPLVRESYREPLQTCSTNIMGTCHLLDEARLFRHKCAVVVITTDKCYENLETTKAYVETDPLGGRDVYSASKAAVELLTHAYRCSFFSGSPVSVATARAGNVIGGGDMARERIVPDAVRASRARRTMILRNPASTRPWQHVLEPLSGYLLLGAQLLKSSDNNLCGAFNFGPELESNKSVYELATELGRHLPLDFATEADTQGVSFHEAGLLNLDSGKAFSLLRWKPAWTFAQAVQFTAGWYRDVEKGRSPIETTRGDIEAYEQSAKAAGLVWSTEES